jgi:hypothetical protein
MAQIYTVTHSDQSKTGKPRVFFDNKHGYQDAYYTGKGAIPPIGARIEASVASMQTKDGKGTLWFLNDWKLASDQPPVEKVREVQAASAVHKDAQQKWLEQEAILRFVSNTVGNALSALQIKAPSDVLPWAESAYKAAVGVLAGKFEGKSEARKHDFDDKVDF